MQELDEIYRAYALPVYRYLLSITGSAAAAEELTSETFYRAAKNISRYDGSCKLLSWLCQIAKHLWYQELEKRKKAGAIRVDDFENLEDALPGPEEAFISNERKLQLYRRLQRLDETTREVFYLRLLGDMSYREIGEILGRSENWARVSFYRGKEKLKKGWNEDE